MSPDIVAENLRTKALTVADTLGIEDAATRYACALGALGALIEARFIAAQRVLDVYGCECADKGPCLACQVARALGLEVRQ